MKKSIRQQIHNKYGGRCAYTGRPLGKDWQVDHALPKCIKQSDPDNTDNLLPAIRIVNHYKRGLGLEGFRKYMMSFHLRLAKLPRNTTIPATQKRKEYMCKVAELFGTTVEKPFDGVFYFETLKQEKMNETDKFLRACKDVRSDFVKIVGRYSVSEHLRLRTEADTLLIMYDQLCERIRVGFAEEILKTE